MIADSEENKIENSWSSKAMIESMFVISISILFISLGMIAIGFFRESFITGAVIGTIGLTSYAIIALIFSLIATFYLSLIRTPRKTR